ncbi:MAG: GMC family oxidoreductase N-terminal domain-containing protein [Solirubrobacteraceae bacterium]
MNEERFDVVVVGSGAGGGVVAAELGARGRSVALLESGVHDSAHDFIRFEARATRRLWWPTRFAHTGEGRPPLVMVGGRCVGGSTTINTKVALRATDEDLAHWHRATGATLSMADLEPLYERVERRLGVRERADWPLSVRTVEPGFRALGAELEPVRSYTDPSCTRCGCCYVGCPTNAGKSTLTSYIEPALSRGELDLRAGCTVTRVRLDTRYGPLRATGVDYVDQAGERQSLDASVVVVAGGTLNTPQILMRSGLPDLGTASASHLGRHLGTHTARIVHGLFDEPQDCHLVYPITARCDAFRRDADGGFVVEATTIMEPIGLASNLVDDDGLPLWGDRLSAVMRDYRHWVGLFAMANDSNTGTVEIRDDGTEMFTKPIPPEDQERLDGAHTFCREVLRAAGARKTVSTGLITSHVQGTCRMGPDPERSVVDMRGQSHDVAGLFVADASLLPWTLSVNPSLTVMALALHVSQQVDSDPDGYLT